MKNEDFISLKTKLNQITRNLDLRAEDSEGDFLSDKFFERPDIQVSSKFYLLKELNDKLRSFKS